MLFNRVKILLPTTLIPAIAITAIRLAMRAYSIAVAPLEFSKNLDILDIIAATPAKQ
jgi:hypothetical protein